MKIEAQMILKYLYKIRYFRCQFKSTMKIKAKKYCWQLNVQSHRDRITSVKLVAKMLRKIVQFNTIK